MYQQTYHLAYAGPHKVAVRLINTRTAGPPGTEAQQMSLPHYWQDIVADGKRYYVFDANFNKYILHPLNPKGWEAEAGTGAGAFQDSFLGDLLLHGRKAMGFPSFKDSHYLGQETVAGVSCDKISSGNPDQDGSLYWIGHADGLLRKMQGKIEGGTLTEAYTILQTKGPLRPQEFAIKPPPGATRVDHF